MAKVLRPLGIASVVRLVTFGFVALVGMDAATAQSGSPTTKLGARPQEAALASTQPASTEQVTPKHAEQYYIEFRSRYAQSYGHTFVVFGRGSGPGKKIRPDQIAGLHPATDSPVPWYIGHVVPVKSETGASEGDTDEIYVSARYRVMLNRAEYDRTLRFIKDLQAKKTLWQAEVYNCNDFVADIARFMGLKVPSTFLFPKDFITGIRDLNSKSHPVVSTELKPTTAVAPTPTGPQNP